MATRARQPGDFDPEAPNLVTEVARVATAYRAALTLHLADRGNAAKRAVFDAKTEQIINARRFLRMREELAGRRTGLVSTVEA